MPREHGHIKLTTDELAEFAAQQTRCIVATVDADGAPWGDAAACVFRDGRLYFRVPTSTRTFQNVQKDGRVCCTLESHPAGSEYYTIKGALLHGRATPTRAPSRELAEALAQLPDPVTGAPLEDGAIFSVGTDDVASFDFAKIQRRFDQ